MNGTEEARGVQRCLRKVKGRRKEKIILILFCKEGRRKRRELILL